MRQKKSKSNSVSLRNFIKYLTPLDYLILIIGILGTWVAGFNWPLLIIFFGKTVDVFVDYAYWYDQNWNNETITDTERELHRIEYMNKVYWISGATGTVFILAILSIFTALLAFQKISLNIINKMKRQYFRSLLWQEIAWFEQHQSGEFASSISSDFQKIENGLNENLCLLVYNLSSAFTHLGIGYYLGWKLALISSTISPLMILGAIITAKLQTYLSKKTTEFNTLASSVAEETISGIRTVFAFNGQKKEIDRYNSMLTLAMKFGCKRNFIQGVSLAIHWTCVYTSLAYGLWYGVHLIVSDSYTIGDVVIVFWLVTGCAFCVGYAAPFLEAFQIGISSSKSIFDVIEKKSLIDSSNESEGTRLLNYRSNIEFRNVHFNYPSRKNVPILKGLNLKINQNEIVALVGPSGCGKSTTFQLLQRMYDPNQGKIYLDNVPIDTLNIGWLREQFGIVGQEPILFDTTIAENIRLGANHDQLNQITQTDIENAAKEANAHEFIIGLEKGYDTYVGDRGVQLSGGQKQRIAIARALISKPKILLLDEATSALDLESEQIVQTALDRASKHCTTIIIAHRLSTIINANRIIYIDNGQVVEEGTHEALMEKKAKYYALVQAQQVLKNNSDLKNSVPIKISLVKQELLDNSSNYRKHSHTTSSDISNVSNKFDLANTFNIEMDEEKQKKEWKKFSFSRLWKLIWLDKWFLIIATITALIYGISAPLYSVFFGDFVNIFAKTQDNNEIKEQTLVYCYMFAGLAASILIVCTTQVSLFGICGERLTKRLRLMAYTAILEKDIPFFDKPENSSGALCARLTNDAANIQGATGLRISMLCQFISSILFSVAIGFTYNWRLALISIVLIPALGIASMISSTIGKIQETSKSAEKCSKTTIEVINAIRTVSSLNKQRYFYNKLNEYLQEHYKMIQMRLMLKSLIFSLAISAPFLAYSLTFLYGGYLVSYGLLQVGDFFKIMECIIFGAMTAGQSAMLSADFTRARLAAINIFKLIDENANDQHRHMNGISKKLTKHNNSNGLKQVISSIPAKYGINLNRSKGNISFKDVHFTYPEREENAIFNGLTFTAQPGQTVAIVGSSGCGKSTSIQLLERFYNCHQGKVLLDGNDIAQVDINWLRSQMSLVSQEPILFSYSIGENIAYGDNSRTVTMDEIKQAARMANVHDFINTLPNNYDTPVGSKGTQLSGGQKQRIAIARALIRDPPILLLDEATSALDTESEELVQKSLDEASKNRTCLIIAHRLKTIVNADKIIVIKKGRNVEEGTHEELLSLEGEYSKLYNRSK